MGFLAKKWEMARKKANADWFKVYLLYIAIKCATTSAKLHNAYYTVLTDPCFPVLYCLGTSGLPSGLKASDAETHSNSDSNSLISPHESKNWSRCDRLFHET